MHGHVAEMSRLADEETVYQLQLGDGLVAHAGGLWMEVVEHRVHAAKG